MEIKLSINQLKIARNTINANQHYLDYKLRNWWLFKAERNLIKELQAMNVSTLIGIDVEIIALGLVK